MTLTPGMAFWVQNQHSASQSVVLFGKVVMDASKSITLSPSMNLFGYPFSSKISLDSTTLHNDGAQGASSQTDSPGPDVISKVSPCASYWLKALFGDPNDGKWLNTDNVLANDHLKPGRGYWYHRAGSSSFTWQEPRPYVNPFDSGSTAPQISGMAISSNGAGMVLTISCSGATGEKLEIFSKSISEDDSFDPINGWTVLTNNIQTNASTSITWTDATALSNASRIYIVSRQDVDTDADGLSNGYETFVSHTNPAAADSDGDGLSDGDEVLKFGTSPLTQDTNSTGVPDGQRDFDGDGITNLYEIASGSDPLAPSLQGSGYSYDQIVIEDAQDGDLANWVSYNGTNYAENIVDPDKPGNRVIKLVGPTSYYMSFPQVLPSSYSIISWTAKNTTSNVFYAYCSTSIGNRMIRYYANDDGYDGIYEGNYYISYSIGGIARDGKYHTR